MLAAAEVAVALLADVAVVAVAVVAAVDVLMVLAVVTSRPPLLWLRCCCYCCFY